MKAPTAVKHWTQHRLELIDSIISEGRREHIKEKLILLLLKW
jgi:hypothetical protein